MLKQSFLPRIHKKHTLALLLAVLFVGCTACAPQNATLPNADAAQPTAPPQAEEIRAVWLSYYELEQPKGATEAQFRARYAEVFSRIKAFGLRTVFVHVRPFCDAIYPSALFPWSAVLTGTQGEDPGYDPLAVLLELARREGLGLHGWINPFRIAKSADTAKLAAGHPALAHILAKDGWVREAGGRLYWNPAVPETHALIYAGVRELLTGYPDLAGIHIDDYFYPTADAAFDAAEYARYRALGGAMELGDWRRGLVSEFVAGMYRAAKRARPGAVFSISPSAVIEKDYGEMFADVERWVREPGYADWIIPQVYFGFEHYKYPFGAVARRWAALAEEADSAVRLLFGLAAYKCGQPDVYAGTGKGEWVAARDILARQLECVRALPRCAGFSVYSYEGLLGDGVENIVIQNRKKLQILLENVKK